jgi:aspartate 1-decarboxylase
VRVTDKSLHYHGSVAICRDLLQAADIKPYEQVHVVNLTNGERWITYAIPGEPGAFSLNGGGARLGEIGDVCIVMTFEMSKTYNSAGVVYCDEKNRIAEVGRYMHATEPSSHSIRLDDLLKRANHLDNLQAVIAAHACP